jgi:hypothetical protein
MAARFFKPRVPTIFSARVPAGQHLGVLGVVKLGDEASQRATTTPVGPREERRRQVRLAGAGQAASPAWLNGTQHR